MIAWIVLSLQIAGLVLTVLFFWIMFRVIFVRIHNTAARIHRLEQMEERRHGFNAAMEETDPNTLKLRCKPDPGCRKCKGRGTIGRNVETGRWIACVCCG